MVKYTFHFFTILALFVFSCSDNDNTPQPTIISVELKQDVVNTYSEIAFLTYSSAVEDANALLNEVNIFIENPTEERFLSVKNAWKKARVSYGQSEVFRFYGGPIDNANTGVEGKLNAWPMDESFIDYIEGNSNAGIINNTSLYPTLSKSLIEELNEKEGETNISVGYHAVEFLLWGQDLSTTSAGTRAFTDYLPTSLGGTNLNYHRRAQYLKIATELIIEHLNLVKAEWNANSNSNYRFNFNTNSNLDHSLRLAFKGLAIFSKAEFGGERMAVAFKNKDQEDEHDCFSDYTTHDFQNWYKGINNVMNGKFEKNDGSIYQGKGLLELIKLKNSDIYIQIIDSLATTENSVKQIPSPFDNAIQNGDEKIKNAYQDLYHLGDQILIVAKELGYNITNEIQ